MHDEFKIYVDQLRNGHETIIDEQLEPDFLDIQDQDLMFNKPVKLKGKAYVAEKELILHWDVKTEALVPCKICNDLVSIDIQIEDLYFTKPLSEIKTGIFNFKDLLRETILLEVPAFTECNGGNCLHRKEMKKYLKEKPTSSSKEDKSEYYQPFADLDLE